MTSSRSYTGVVKNELRLMVTTLKADKMSYS